MALSVAPVLLLGLLTALGWRHFVTGMDAGGVVTIPKAPAVLVVCMVTVLGMLELTLAEWWSYVRVSSTGEAAEAALPPVWWTGLSTRVPSAATFVPVPYARSH